MDISASTSSNESSAPVTGQTGELSWFQLPAGEVRVFPHGAHLSQWKASDGSPLLFLSGSSGFRPDKAIRGGVPLIFPWFGAHDTDPTLPSHGFARTSEWELIESNASDRAGLLRFELNSNEQTRRLWPFDFQATYSVLSRADELRLRLRVENKSPEIAEFEAVLHTYFQVSDVRNIAIQGFEGATYLDQLTDKHEVQEGEITFTAETDRIYSGTSGYFAIRDPGVGRQIIVRTDSPSAVVWNPWIDKAKRLADLGDDEWPFMVCLESGHIGDEKVRLEPGKAFEMWVTYTWKR